MKTRYNILPVLALAALGTAAQDLHKEITVDRTVVPVLRESSRPGGLAPAIVVPPVKGNKLSAAEYTIPSKIDNEAAELPAAPWRDSVEITPWRGYASIGYLPAANFGANAGYRFYSTDRAHAGAWMQYDLANWRGDLLNPSAKGKLGFSSLAIGADARYRLSGTSVLDADLEYTHNSIGTPWMEQIQDLSDRYGQRSHKFKVDGRWAGAFEGVKMHAGVEFENFGFGDNIPAKMRSNPLKPAWQNVFTFDLGAGATDGYSPLPWLGADVDWTFVNTNADAQMQPEGVLDAVRAKYSLGHLRPYLVIGDDETIFGRVGFNLSVSTGNDNGHVRIAPDVQVGWKATPIVTLYGKAGGGEYINKESALFDSNHFMANYYSYERSNLALELEGGAKVLPFAGMHLDLYAGYAIGRNRLTPNITCFDPVSHFGQFTHTISLFDRSNINSWRAGAKASYTYKEMVGLSASLEISGSNRDYATWQYYMDGARIVSQIALDVHPIDPLHVAVGYELRTDRKNASQFIVTDVYILSPDYSPLKLGNVGNLNLSADYRYDKQTTLFLSVENALNKRYYLVGGMPAQGIHGLLGVAYKF